MSSPETILRQIPLADLQTTEASLQCRLLEDRDVIEEYAESYRAGAVIPPLLVYQLPDERYVIVDGYHRRDAAMAAGRTEINCMVRRDTLDAARWAAAGANLAHGLRRTRADKALAVQRALLLRPDLSDRAIAQHTGTSHPFVAQLRRTGNSSSSAADPAPRVGLDGKTRPVPLPRPAAPPNPASQGPEPDDPEGEPLACGTLPNRFGVYPKDSPSVETFGMGDAARTALIFVARLSGGDWIRTYAISYPDGASAGPLCSSPADRFRSRGAAISDAARLIQELLPAAHAATPTGRRIIAWAQDLIDHEPPPAAPADAARSPLRARLEELLTQLQRQLDDGAWLAEDHTVPADDTVLIQWAETLVAAVRHQSSELLGIAIALAEAIGCAPAAATPPAAAPVVAARWDALDDSDRARIARMPANEQAILFRHPVDVIVDAIEYLDAHPKVSVCQALSIVERRLDPYGVGKSLRRAEPSAAEAGA